ncbi:MAG: hypothetical protein L3J96_04130 [Thermoplasmata archaeon]|nr:hypothetical protein [Thermoplasmata archaeon]
MTSAGLGGQRGPGIGAILLSLILLAVAVLVFAGIYLVDADHYGALLWIGTLCLFLALASYLLQSFSRNPLIQRSLGWGFLGMGFTLLFVTVGVSPSIATTWRIVGFVILLLLLAGAVAGVSWRMRSAAQEHSSETRRRDWGGRPAPNAFDYGAGQPASPPGSGEMNPPSPPSGGM